MSTAVNITCPKCRMLRWVEIKWSVCRDGRTMHLDTICGTCDGFIRRMPQKPLFFMAPPKPTIGEAPKSKRRPCGGVCLVERILATDNLHRALREVCKRRDGQDPGAGLDGIRPRDLRLKSILPQITEDIWGCNYVARPMKITRIPKWEGGTRALHIPTARDRLVLRAIFQIIAPLIDPHLSPHCFGYRPNRNQWRAVQRIGEGVRWTGNAWCVSLDIQGAFDSLSHDLIMERLRRFISCEHVLTFIRAHLRCLAMTLEEYRSGKTPLLNQIGLPQGGSLSPLLCNLAFTDLDRFIQARRRIFARYGDDVRILVPSGKAGEKLLTQIKKFLGTFNLKAHAVKSKFARSRKRNSSDSFSRREVMPWSVPGQYRSTSGRR